MATITGRGGQTAGEMDRDEGINEQHSRKHTCSTRTHVHSPSRWEVRVKGFDGNLEEDKTDDSEQAGDSIQTFSAVKHYTVLLK